MSEEHCEAGGHSLGSVCRMYLLDVVVTNRTEFIASMLSALSTKRMYDKVNR